MLPPSSRRRSLLARAPRVTDQDVLVQLRHSLEALLKANRALADMKALLVAEAAATHQL